MTISTRVFSVLVSSGGFGGSFSAGGRPRFLLTFTPVSCPACSSFSPLCSPLGFFRLISSSMSFGKWLFFASGCREREQLAGGSKKTQKQMHIDKVKKLMLQRLYSKPALLSWLSAVHYCLPLKGNVLALISVFVHVFLSAALAKSLENHKTHFYDTFRAAD